MKNLLLFSALALGLAAVPAAAQTRTFTATLSATGPTTSVWADANYHTLQVTVGSPVTCTIQLEGSLDNNTWFSLSGSQSCTSSTMFHVDGKPVAYVRANLLTYSGGGTVSLIYKGSN